VNFDTVFTLALARSVDVPGVVVPKVDPLPATVMVIGVLFVDEPWLSVTFSTALYVPAVEYVNDGFATVESPNVPSPFRSHEYEIVSPASGSDEPDPSKFTVNGAAPEVGDADATAVGGLLPPEPV
jgi:hypothetical protein